MPAIRPAPERAPAGPILDVLFRDRRFAVVDKPAGLPVHAGRGDPDGPTVERSFHQFGTLRAGPWLAHRLDRDTSGCLVIALRRRALIEAQACFASGRAHKTYWAIVAGDPGPGGTVRSRLGRVERGRAWRMEEMPDGDPAETEWRRGASADGRSWLELFPRTGRTHQIRAHCRALGCPIVGDRIYGDPDDPARLLLHARAIALALDPDVAATAPPPVAMQRALAALGAA